MTAFIVVVGTRMASLHWSLQTPVPADADQKLTSRNHQNDKDIPQTSGEDKPQ